MKKSIDYFENIEIKRGEQLGLFFFFKLYGISTFDYISYKKFGQMTSEEKMKLNNGLYDLSGVFDENESGKERSCLFPFSIQKEIPHAKFYNGKAFFIDLLGRISDTIDNTLIDRYLDQNQKNNEYIKLKRNYIPYIKENYLKDRKISIVNFSIWVCRFVDFNIEEETSKEQFTRICTKHVIEYLNITDEEMQELFNNDSSTNLIEYSENPISGENLRGLLDFKDTPEIEKSVENKLGLAQHIITLEESNLLAELKGDNPSNNEIKRLLELKKQIILYGVPGIGKTRFISQIETGYDDITKIQFHPSTSYEEFIGGSTIENGNIVNKAGKFLEKCNEAAENIDKKYLFVIDEINRGNISKIFGEVILTLDREYQVDLIKSIQLNGKEIKTFKIPDNMFIIGTMNTADRSIAVLDYAIRRRFSFVKLHPNYEVVKELSNTDEIDIDISELFKKINQNILLVLGEEELLLGQSYFLPDFADKLNDKIKWTKEILKIVFNYSIIPILEEYTYGNKNDLDAILGSSVSTIIHDSDKFLEEIKKFMLEAL